MIIMNIDINLLDETINDLKNNPNACTLYGGGQSNDGTYTIPESHVGEQLSKFMNYLYQNNLMDMQYVENSKKLDKVIDNYNYDEVLTALTSIIRGDRFVSGHIYSCVKDGTMLKLLERLKNVCTKHNEALNMASDMARMMNYRLHAEQLFIPVLNGFTVENDNNPQTILVASGHGFTEQVTSDGHLESGEFEQRIDLVINSTKQFMKNSGCENADNSFIYYKDYNNGVFNFKIYVCDMIIPVNGERKVIRQFIAYFEEPNMQDFYQLSLSAGPFTLPTEMLKTGIIDTTNDQVTMSLNNVLKTLMDNLKYKN